MYSMFNSAVILTKEELHKLVVEYQETGSKDALDKISRSLIKLIWDIADKKYNNMSLDMKQELFSEGMLGVIKAAKTFKVSKDVSFITYSTVCANNQMLMYLRKGNKAIYKQTMSIETVVSVLIDGSEMTIADLLYSDDFEKYEDELDRKEALEILHYSLKQLYKNPTLLKRNTKIIYDLYFNGMKQVDIAEKYDISQAQVSRLTIRVEDYMKKMMKKRMII